MNESVHRVESSPMVLSRKGKRWHSHHFFLLAAAPRAASPSSRIFSFTTLLLLLFPFHRRVSLRLPFFFFFFHLPLLLAPLSFAGCVLVPVPSRLICLSATMRSRLVARAALNLRISYIGSASQRGPVAAAARKVKVFSRHEQRFR